MECGNICGSGTPNTNTTKDNCTKEISYHLMISWIVTSLGWPELLQRSSLSWLRWSGDDWTVYGPGYTFAKIEQWSLSIRDMYTVKHNNIYRIYLQHRVKSRPVSFIPHELVLCWSLVHGREYMHDVGLSSKARYWTKERNHSCSYSGSY